MTDLGAGVRPAWVHDGLFPFESRFVRIDGNTIHYVDEGRGPTIVMYHGNPTWSFLYRGIIEALRTEFRCVAFDYPGFGLSTPAPHFGFTLREFIEVSAAFVDRLNLPSVTSFVQDWGGPIGLSVAARHPERQSGLIVGNTFAWPADRFLWKVMSVIMGGPLGKLLIDRGNALAGTVGSAHRLRRLSAEESKHYTAPFPTPAERRATRSFIGQIHRARAELELVERRVFELSEVPALLLWGTGDFFYGQAELERLQSMLPKSTVQVLEGAGHFIQSEVPEAISSAVSGWMHRNRIT